MATSLMECLTTQDCARASELVLSTGLRGKRLLMQSKNSLGILHIFHLMLKQMKWQNPPDIQMWESFHGSYSAITR